MSPTDRPLITAEERAHRKAGIDQARASCRLEGIILPPEIEAINQRYIDGEISLDEHVQLGLAAAGAMLGQDMTLHAGEVIPPGKPASGFPEWIDDGEYVELDMHDPEVKAKYDEFVRRRNYPLPPGAGANALLTTAEAAAKLEASRPLVSMLCDQGKLGEVVIEGAKPPQEAGMDAGRYDFSEEHFKDVVRGKKP